ncbi:TRAP-type C4-dicarboxylate transport system, periplasmic component [Moritella sp. JT01]|uniref:TRAP transporter substrate-binding protein n=1 Tax=Moritella sp. JT01 TaxID=756698 RepID=UPI0007951358|nr:TRAP transporter substrate-binding protein DctP [Moritella sp. JT01]KXO13418.1 TRAP-type C4-dicarboxylate transport system, periplasmic component [Moritella sp. JT01]
MRPSKLIALLFSTMVVTFPAAAVTELKISLQLPITHPLGQNLIHFKDKVEKESQGNFKVKIYPSAQLYKDKDVPAAVSSGAINMGVASLTRFAGTIPAVDLFFVPFMFPTYDSVVKATAPNSKIRQKLDAEMTKTGARPLWWQAYGSTVILSKGKPIKHPQDMTGKKVRVFGKIVGELVTAVNGSPTMISGSEQFMAYQRGTVDAGMTGLTAIASRKLYDVMDYVTLTNHADIEFVVLINDKFWLSLTPKQQQILTVAAHQVEKELRGNIVEKEHAALDKIKKTSMQVITLNDAEIRQWKAASSPVVETYITSAGELGNELVKLANAL